MLAVGQSATDSHCTWYGGNLTLDLELGRKKVVLIVRTKNLALLFTVYRPTMENDQSKWPYIRKI